MKPVALYVRLSQDDGESTALARQEKDARALAEREGWTVTRVYSDNDVSAWSGKTRPAFEELLTDVRAGAYEVVIAWKLDRITRAARAWLNFREALEASGTRFVTCVDGIDSTNGAFGLVSAVLTEMAVGESKSSSIRQKAKQRELREAGAYRGGGVRAFGHTQDRREVVEEEAAVIREVADRLLAGESVHGIVRDLHERAIPGVTGSTRWGSTTLRDMLLSYRLAGYVEQTDGSDPVKSATIAPILPLDIVERLRSLLLARKINTGVRHTRHLLGGLTYCGGCGKKLHVSATTAKQRQMVCKSGNGGGCGKLTVRADHVENRVMQMVVAAVNNEAWNEAMQGGAIAKHTALISQVESDRATIERLTHDHYVDGLIDRQTYAKALRPLQDRVADAEAKLALSSKATVLTGLNGLTLDTFDALPMSQRQALVKAAVQRVVIAPVGSGSGPKFRNERVSIEWAV